MKKLKKVELHNYKTHEHTVIEFHDSVTAVVGDNDAGKTNIWRALRMVLLSKPFPVAHVKRGHKSGYVLVEFDDGSSITRSRSGQKQSFLLVYPDGTTDQGETIQGESFRDKVKELSGFTDEEALQFIGSKDVTYLLEGVSADVILRRITKMMSGLGIETAKQKLESRLTKNKSDIKAYEPQLEQKQKVMDLLNHPQWGEHEQDYKRLVSRFEGLQSRKARLDTLEELGRLYRAANAAVRQSQSIQAVKTEDLAQRVAALEAKKERLTNLLALQAKGDKLEQELQTYDTKLQETIDQIGIAEMLAIDEENASKVCPTCGKPK